MPNPPVLSLLTDYLNQARSLQPSEPSTSSKKAGKKKQSESQKPTLSKTASNESKNKSAIGGTNSSEEQQAQT